MPRLASQTFAALLTLVSLSQAQTTAPAALFLIPDSFDTAPGAKAALGFESIDALLPQSAPWPDSIKWLFVRSPGFQENRSQDDAPRPIAGERTISIPLDHPGITVIGLDLPSRTVEWPAEKMPAVAGASQRPQDPPPTGPVRVRLIQSAKTILTVGDPDAGTVGTGKTGQAVEIRPLMDPALAPVGSDILLRVYIDGDSVKNAAITANNAAAAQTQEIKLSPTGAAFFHVTAPGLWRLEFTQARPLEGNADAKWTVYSATLTFQSPGAPAPVPAKEGTVNP